MAVGSWWAAGGAGTGGEAGVFFCSQAATDLEDSGSP